MKRNSNILVATWTIALFLAIGIDLLAQNASSPTEGIFRNLGPGINTEGDEYLPNVYKDTLYFRRSFGYQEHEILLTDISGYNCMNEAVSFELVNIKKYTNTTVDANRTIRSNLSTPSFNNYSDSIQLWDKSYEMEELSSEGHDFHPSFSVTGDTLVFASTRPDPNGQSDLYVAVRRSNGKWSRPRKLPRGINTDENEISPYIALDGTLYYSSKGFTKGRATVAVSGKSRSKNSNLYFLESSLNYDIIKAELGDKFWTDPQKMPYPVNTEFDDLGPTVYKGKLYLSSNRSPAYDWGNNYGGFDIYGWCNDNCCDSTCADIAILGKVIGSAYDNTPNALVEIIKMPEGDIIHSLVLENNPNYYIEIPQHSDYAIRTYHNCLIDEGKYIEERIEHDCNTCCLDTFMIETTLEGGCPNCNDMNIFAGNITCNGSSFVCGSHIEVYDNKNLILGEIGIDSNGYYTLENIPKKDEYEIRFYSDCLIDSLEYIEKYIADLTYSATGQGKTIKTDFEIPQEFCYKYPNVFVRGRTMCGTAHTYDYSMIVALDKYGNRLGEAITNRFGEFNLPIEQVCPMDSVRLRLITECVMEGYMEKIIAFDNLNDSMNILHLDFDHPRNCCVSCEALLFEGRVLAKGANIGIGKVEFYRVFQNSPIEKIDEVAVNEDGSFYINMPYWPQYRLKYTANCLKESIEKDISADFPCKRNELQYLFTEFDISNSPCGEDVCTDVIHNFSTSGFNIFVENSTEVNISTISNPLENQSDNNNNSNLPSLREQSQKLSLSQQKAQSEKVEKAINEAIQVILSSVEQLSDCPDCSHYEFTVTAFNDDRSNSILEQIYYGKDLSNSDIILLPYSLIGPGIKMDNTFIGEVRAYNLIVELQRHFLNNEELIQYYDKITWKAVGSNEVKTDNNTASLKIKCSSSPKKMKKLKIQTKLPKFYGRENQFDGMKR